MYIYRYKKQTSQRQQADVSVGVKGKAVSNSRYPRSSQRRSLSKVPEPTEKGVKETDVG